MTLLPEPHTETDELVFRTEPDVPWWRIPTVGALLGLCGWLLFDRDVSWYRLLIWAVIGAAGCSLYLLPAVQRTVLEEIRVRPDGFTAVWKGRTREYAWSELEAAYFERYPVVNLGAYCHYLRLRAGGKNTQVCLDEFDEPTRLDLCATLARCLRACRVPERSPALPTFECQLSRYGAFVFVLSIWGMLIANWFVYHTLGTIFGLAFMVTGAGMAYMTRKERLSRWVLAGTAILIVAGSGIIWAFDINVREVLQQWEIRERRLGRPPWEEPRPNADAHKGADAPRKVPEIVGPNAFKVGPRDTRGVSYKSSAFVSSIRKQQS